MARKGFEDFRWSCFDPSFHAVRNGLDLAALLRLTGDERAEAERLVLEALPTTVDSRPIQAAGYLRLQAASEILKQRLATNFDGERVYNRVNTAEALHRIEAWPAATAVVVEALRDRVRSGEWTALVVVDALREIGPSPEAFAAVMARLPVEGDTFAASQLTDLLEHLADAEGGDEALVAIPERERTELEQTILRQLERTRSDGDSIDVPCGRFHLEGLAGTGAFTIRVHGRSALFVEGSVNVGSLAVVLDPGAELDLFVEGSVTAISTLMLGTTDAPRKVRLYLGGTTLNLQGASLAAGNLYAPRANLTTGGSGLVLHGSLFVGSVNPNGDLEIHYDRGVLDSAAECAPHPSCTSCLHCGGPACTGGACGSCTTDADCCSPYVCRQGGCTLGVTIE